MRAISAAGSNHHGPQTYPPGNHGLPFGPHPHRGIETVKLLDVGA
jgi:quercetin 2,3-dioxygenase